MNRYGALVACMLGVLLLAPIPAAQADAFDDAQAFFENGDPAQGIEVLNAVAETGDAAMQYKAGVALINYSRDDGVKWIESAAERGHAEAQLDLGVFYLSGNGIERDLAHAFKWFYLAQQGDLDPALRDDTRRKMKETYAAMTPRERYNAEQLIRYWQPRK